MSKRKNRNPGGSGQVRQTQSFENFVSEAMVARMKGYVDQQVYGAMQPFVSRQIQAAELLSAMGDRLNVIEQIVKEKLGVTAEDLATRLALAQDEKQGYKPVEGAVEPNDRVRLEVKTKKATAENWTSTNRMMVDATGSGQTLGPQLEKALIGLLAGETREVIVGSDDNAVQVSMLVNKISRRPRPPAPQPQEAQSAEPSPNAG